MINFKRRIQSNNDSHVDVTHQMIVIRVHYRYDGYGIMRLTGRTFIWPGMESKILTATFYLCYSEKGKSLQVVMTLSSRQESFWPLYVYEE